MDKATTPQIGKFLSIQAQDFIEETDKFLIDIPVIKFLSIQAQDFIEDLKHLRQRLRDFIPEHSSSGLH